MIEIVNILILTSCPSWILSFMSLWQHSSKSTLDLIVKYIVLRKLIKFVFVWSRISSFCATSIIKINVDIDCKYLSKYYLKYKNIKLGRANKYNCFS